MYDLKAEQKKRDDSKQPWIILKGRRLMAGLIEDSVNKMGHMVGCEEGKIHEQKGSDKKKLDAKPLDINALLAERKKKLTGMNVDQLEANQEKKRKEHLKDMSSNEPPKRGKRNR